MDGVLFYLTSCFAGDGGNDVSMIQAADCGIGIEGKVGSPFYQHISTHSAHSTHQHDSAHAGPLYTQHLLSAHQHVLSAHSVSTHSARAQHTAHISTRSVSTHQHVLSAQSAHTRHTLDQHVLSAHSAHSFSTPHTLGTH